MKNLSARAREFKVPKRNWKGIQFEELRRHVDPEFNSAHDALSKAYYEKRSFVWKGKDWGILEKELFDRLHGLIFHLRTLAFHQANMMLPTRKRIPEAKYNDIYDGDEKVVGKKTEISTGAIEKLEKKGIRLEI